MIDIAETQPETPEHRASWYLRSTGDHDTHVGVLETGTVFAVCGAVFGPKWFLRTGGPALPSYPPDPDQVCPKCKRK